MQLGKCRGHRSTRCMMRYNIQGLPLCKQWNQNFLHKFLLSTPCMRLTRNFQQIFLWDTLCIHLNGQRCTRLDCNSYLRKKIWKQKWWKILVHSSCSYLLLLVYLHAIFLFREFLITRLPAWHSLPIRRNPNYDFFFYGVWISQVFLKLTSGVFIRLGIESVRAVQTMLELTI